MNLTATHSRCSDHIYAIQLSLNSIAGLKASWTAYCVVSHHWSELIHKKFFEDSRADSKISEFTYSYAGGSGHLACIEAVSSDACIIDRRWCTVLSTVVLILIGRVILAWFHVASQSIWHLKKWQVVMSSLYAVHLARPRKLDTLLPFCYYELLMILFQLSWILSTTLTITCLAPSNVLAQRNLP